jgi:hypothetical protein
MTEEKERLRKLYIALTEKIKENVTNIETKDGKAIFELSVHKPHIDYKEYIELPVTDEFLERYCLNHTL